jgi:hypothetical protein
MEKQSFNTIAEALQYAHSFLRSSPLPEGATPVYANRIWSDFFPRFRPKTMEAKLLGFSRKAALDCKRSEPNGKFWVVPEETGGGVRFSCWYDRYLPYALAMLHAEDGYKALGVDYESVNAYFGTVHGFNQLGQDRFDILNQQDFELYDNVSHASLSIEPPQLPFDEAHRPALCYVFALRPQEVYDWLGGDKSHWLIEHAHRVMERCEITPPYEAA